MMNLMCKERVMPAPNISLKHREIMKIWLTLSGLWAQEIIETITTADPVWDFKNYKEKYILKYNVN